MVWRKDLHLNIINWSGLGTTIFSISGNGICWNGTYFIAVGKGINTIAYSSNGTQWTGLGNIEFNIGNKVGSNNSSINVASGFANTIYVAVGQSTNTIAYSYDVT